MSTASGSCGATRGAKIETATMSRRIPAATNPQRSRSRRRQAAPCADPDSERSGTIWASSTGVGTLIAASRGANAGVDDPHDDVHDQVDGHDEQGQQD